MKVSASRGVILLIFFKHNRVHSGDTMRLGDNSTVQIIAYSGLNKINLRRGSSGQLKKTLNASLDRTRALVRKLCAEC